jgi:hypothetical protein
VKLVNTDGMAFIGPGSEWFWTAVSGLVLAVTFVAIYRQLSLQRDAAAIDQMERMMKDWTSERMARSMLSIYLAVEAGADPAAIPDRAAAEIGDFWERVGYLTRRGHVDRRLVHEMGSTQVQRWWGRLHAYTLASRESEPGVWMEFEWLAGAMARLDAKRGTTDPPHAGDLSANLPTRIAEAREAIALEEGLRTVPVRIVSTPVPVAAVRAHGGDGRAPAAPADAPASPA